MNGIDPERSSLPSSRTRAASKIPLESVLSKGYVVNPYPNPIEATVMNRTRLLLVPAVISALVLVTA